MAIFTFMFFLFSMLMAVSLASINVNGIAERHKHIKVFELLRSFNFDLIFMQETHLADTFSGEAWEKDWGGQCAWSPGSNRSAGVAVFVHPNSSVKIADFQTDLAGRVVMVKLEFEGRFFQAVNVYMPNIHAEHESFFDSLWRFAFPNLNTFEVGDFNCVPNIQLDKWIYHISWPRDWEHLVNCEHLRASLLGLLAKIHDLVFSVFCYNKFKDEC